jgi:hypothetical protein
MYDDQPALMTAVNNVLYHYLHECDKRNQTNYKNNSFLHKTLPIRH